MSNPAPNDLYLDKSQWVLTRLGDLASDVNDRVANPAESEHDRFVGLEHFVSGHLKIKDWKPTDGLVSAAKAFKSGDVLFARRNAYLKRASMVNFDGVCSGDAFVLREDHDKVVPGYLAFVMNSKSLWRHAISNAAGTMSKRVKWRDLASYEFLLPPKDQQAKLAELLWVTDEAIEAHRNLHTKSEQFKASRTRDLLTASEGEQTTQCKLGLIPEDWECVSLQELIDSGAIVSHLDGNHGADYPRNEEFVSSGIPYISANSIESGTVDFGKAKYLTIERAARIRKGVAQDGDVLLAHNATVGPTCELKTAEKKVILGTSLTYYRVDAEKLSSAYLLSYMKSRFFQKQLEQVMSQSTRNQVPITTQRKLLFLIPPRSQQDLVAETVENLSEPIKSAQNAAGASQQLLKSLINQIF
ncbi:MAG: restriction endonuclease subunit S [Verrucomicrobiaceae bacterium]